MLVNQLLMYRRHMLQICFEPVWDCLGCQFPPQLRQYAILLHGPGSYT